MDFSTESNCTRQTKNIKTTTVTVLGNSQVGKTCFVKRLLNDTFNQNEPLSQWQEKFDCPVERCDDFLLKLLLIDTPGRKQFRSQSASQFTRSQVIIICYDMSQTNQLD